MQVVLMARAALASAGLPGALPQSGDVIASALPAILGALSAAIIACALYLRRKK